MDKEHRSKYGEGDYALALKLAMESEDPAFREAYSQLSVLKTSKE